MNERGRARVLSTALHEFGAIRPPVHPAWRRCVSSKDPGYSCGNASCQAGASTPSVVTDLRSAVLSVSRRTDVPRHYARWFARRRAAGRVAFRNAFGGYGEVSLRDADVLGYVFWTRFARPFDDALGALRGDGLPHAFQYTINGYGPPLEPGGPREASALSDFLRQSARLPATSGIEWRYDPLVLVDRNDPRLGVRAHLRRFRRLAAALSGATRVVNTSVVEPYLRTVRRVADPEVRYRAVDPARHRAVAARFPDLLQVGTHPESDAASLLREMAAVATEYGIELRACANPEWDLPPARCCSAALFEAWNGVAPARIAAIRALGERASRAGCRCMETVDIGMDNTCPSGCRYCYVVPSPRTARRHFAAHDPDAEMLR